MLKGFGLLVLGVVYLTFSAIGCAITVWVGQRVLDVVGL